MLSLLNALLCRCAYGLWSVGGTSLSSPLDCESGSRFYTDAMRYHLRSDRINPQCVTIRHFMCLLPFCLHSMCIDCDSALYVRLSPSCLHLMCALVCPTGHQTPSLTVSHTIFKAVGIETRVTRTHTRSDTSCLTAIANENMRLTAIRPAAYTSPAATTSALAAT